MITAIEIPKKEITVQQICPAGKILALEQLPVFTSSDFPLSVFDPLVIDFFNDLSKSILRNRTFNRIPAMAALGFWLRKTNIKQLIQLNQHLVTMPNVKPAPLGVVFHICPSNVDTMFLYSLVTSLLTGNKNILRISSNLDHPFIAFIFESINQLIQKEQYQLLQQYINIVTYGHELELNTFFSKRANARIIWGGDQTISLFKSIPTNPKTKDISFPDRLSFSIFKTANFLQLEEVKQRKITKDFYNDAYTFDQKGCASPQTIFLLGKEKDNKKFGKIFYRLLEDISAKEYVNDLPSLANLKFNELVGEVLDGKVKSCEIESNNLYLIETPEAYINHSCGGGYFYTFGIADLAVLKDKLTSKVQTISYFGLEQEDIDQLVRISFGRGVERIVPVGKSLDFDFIWDGYNLIEELCCKKKVI